MDCPSNILVVHAESHLNVSNYLVKSGKACADMLSSMNLQARMKPNICSTTGNLMEMTPILNLLKTQGK